MHTDDVGVAVADEVLHRVDGQPSGDTGADSGAEDVQKAGGGTLGLGEHRLGQGAVAGDDVAGDLEFVEGQLHLAAVVEVRLEAGPVLDHQFAELRQRQEADDVVVGGVEEVALAAADLADGHRTLDPLLSGGPGRGDDPFVAVHRLVDGPQDGRDDGPQPLLDEIQPDVSAAGPPGPRAHLAPGVGAPVQLRPDLQRACQGHRAGRCVDGAALMALMTLVTRGQLQPAAHLPPPSRTPVPTIKADYCGAGDGAAGWIESVANSPYL